MLNIALAKGRLAEDGMDILQKCGLDCSVVDINSRKLIFTDTANDVTFILVKPSDVPTYVERGVADIGIVGKDTLMEQNLDLYEMLDLGIGKCRMCIAAQKGAGSSSVSSALLRVATKYPGIARSYYESKGIAIDVIKLNGSVELGPLVGLSDVIVDVVQSGSTLRENGLEVTEVICEISARLIVNKVSLKTKNTRITPIISAIRAKLEE